MISYLPSSIEQSSPSTLKLLTSNKPKAYNLIFSPPSICFLTPNNNTQFFVKIYNAIRDLCKNWILLITSIYAKVSISHLQK
ncbi:hypothetical protein BSPWISOXPB_6647 [uncultured Gammaproteobacteria bacterium]|nr:hypothetical protein BSPWISOXPB_6647 [uncultured Gammaproteobacteria bacterium]